MYTGDKTDTMAGAALVIEVFAPDDTAGNCIKGYSAAPFQEGQRG